MNPDTTTQTAAPAAPPAPAAPAPVPAADPASVAKMVLDALDAREQAAKERSAKASADPMAALAAERDQALATVAEREAKAAAEAEARVERKYQRREALRNAGCLDPDLALLADPGLLKAEDPAANIEALRKLKPLLFAAPQAAQAPGPAPRTMPATSTPGGNGAGPSASDAIVARHLGIDPAKVAGLSSRIVRN